VVFYDTYLINYIVLQALQSILVVCDFSVIMLSAFVTND